MQKQGSSEPEVAEYTKGPLKVEKQPMPHPSAPRFWCGRTESGSATFMNAKEADAMLYAAAPELVHALQTLMLYERDQPGTFFMGDLHIVNAALRKAGLAAA